MNAAYHRAWYAKNQAKRTRQIRASQKRRIEATNARLRAIKESTPCADCKACFPHYVMDFDHVCGEKLENVGTLAAQAAAWSRIQAEVDKCEIVCSNCHRTRTWLRAHSEEYEITSPS